MGTELCQPINKGEKTKMNHAVSSYKLQGKSSSISKLHLLIIRPNWTNKINTKIKIKNK